MPLAKKFTTTFPDLGEITFRINFGSKKDGSACYWSDLEKINLGKRVERDRVVEIISIISEERDRRKIEETTYKFWLIYAFGCVRLPIKDSTLSLIQSQKLRGISFLEGHERLVRFWFKAYGEKFIGDKLVSTFQIQKFDPPRDSRLAKHLDNGVFTIEGEKFIRRTGYSTSGLWSTKEGIKVAFRPELLSFFEDLEKRFASLVDQIAERLVVPEDKLLELARISNLLPAPKDENQAEKT